MTTKEKAAYGKAKKILLNHKIKLIGISETILFAIALIDKVLDEKIIFIKKSPKTTQNAKPRRNLTR